MQIRDRVKELRRVKAGLLRPNPQNWRTHPQTQQDALRGVLAEIGYAAALLARELPDGTLELIDGHLRAETTPDMEVPVLVVELDDREAAKLLALHDPLTGMAESNDQALSELLAEVETDSEAVQGLFDKMLADAQLSEDAPADAAEPHEVDVPESFQVVIECDGEDQQQAVYQRLSGEGFKCRLLTL